ncbi:TetR/AcrR family transcriptional regulator [Hyphomonas sp.]|uniref:TetR/AcrR family transcriptional regulator n=1 Tax=Hyphomonas sp. TaxID=87 RepID=UPI003528BD4B
MKRVINMGRGISTADRIAEAGRRLFNSKGYAATSLNEIAAEVGISQGNLTYHFPAKRDLALRIEADARQIAQARRKNLKPSSNIAEDYVEHLLFAMSLTWDHRFLFRDRTQFGSGIDVRNSESELTADFDELHTLLKRIAAAGMFRQDAVTDLLILTRAIWIVSRYWMDYLSEFEGREEITWKDQERGIEHHYAVLLPCLTAEAKRDFRAALTRAPRQPIGNGTS